MDEEGDAATDQERTVERALAASSLGPLAQRQEGVAQMIVEDGPGWQISKLTHLFRRDEALLYARLHYILDLTDAVADQDAPQGFRFPDMDNLLRADYRLRTSVRQQTRKILESITKIFERGGSEGGGGRGLFGRRKG